MPTIWLWGGFGWLCPFSGPYFCFPLSAFCFCRNGALGGSPRFLVQVSRFEVRRSTFSLRPEPPTQESRLPPFCRKAGLYYEARRRLEWPKVIPRESPMTARRLSHDSPMCLPGSDNRFGLCNWGPSDVSQKKTLYHLQIQRAAHPQSRSGHYVRVNRRRAHVHMTEQILERADLRAGKQGTNFELPTLNIERRTGLLASLPLSWPTRRLTPRRGSAAATWLPARVFGSRSPNRIIRAEYSSRRSSRS